MTSINLRNTHHKTSKRIFTTAFLVMIALSPEIKAGNLERITIKSDDERHEFNVEVMRKSHERASGLMHRDHLDQDAGMLFDFKRQLIARMWMRNTLIPLDMLFIHEDGEIINIRQNTIPHSQEILSSNIEVRYVLEINGGLSEKLGIKPGDQMELLKP